MSSKPFANDLDPTTMKLLEATVWLLVDMLGKGSNPSPLLWTLWSMFVA